MLYAILAVATVLIIYFYITTSWAERNSKQEAGPQDSAPGQEARPLRERTLDERGRPKRFCPICGSEMGPYDKLYGEIYKAEPRDKVFIKGCRHCHALPGKPESRPDFEGELDL